MLGFVWDEVPLLHCEHNQHSLCASAHVGWWFEKILMNSSTFFVDQLGLFGFFQFSRSKVRKRLYEESATDSSPALKPLAGNRLSGNPHLARSHPTPPHRQGTHSGQIE